jgi:hypothetical protein
LNLRTLILIALCAASFGAGTLYSVDLMLSWKDFRESITDSIDRTETMLRNVGEEYGF